MHAHPSKCPRELWFLLIPPPGLGVLQVDLTAGATLGEMAADLGATQFTGG